MRLQYQWPWPSTFKYYIVAKKVSFFFLEKKILFGTFDKRDCGLIQKKGYYSQENVCLCPEFALPRSQKNILPIIGGMRR